MTHDLDLDAITASLPTFTKVGAAALREKLKTPITDADDLQELQNHLRKIHRRIKQKGIGKKIQECRSRLKEAEAHVESISNATKDTRNAEYYSQVLWEPSSHYAWLNELDLLNELIVFTKSILVPGLSIIMPLLLLILPIIILNNKSWGLSDYLDVLLEAVQKTMPSGFAPRFKNSPFLLARLGEQFAHVAVACAMFGISIWTQITAAISLRSVVADMRMRAQALRNFVAATSELAGLLDPTTSLAFIPKSEKDLSLFGTAWNNQTSVLALLADAGELDALAAIVMAKKICFPTHQKGEGIRLKSLYHPGIAEGGRVYNNIQMTPDKSHVLLTGPNRGGKSTVLKAIGAAVLMSQTLGIVFAREANIPVFENIVTAMEPRDHVGALSLFESEIEFAKKVRELRGPTFLMMDEIFHGTNALDGVEASCVFLDELFVSKTIYSVISTHYKELPERYKESVQTLCMEASTDPDIPDKLRYSYRLRPGVNCLSSVREILRERGLVR